MMMMMTTTTATSSSIHAVAGTSVPILITQGATSWRVFSIACAIRILPQFCKRTSSDRLARTHRHTSQRGLPIPCDFTQS